MEADFRDLLLDYAPLGALVGRRIYWGNFPQGTANPTLRMTKVAGVPSYTMAGPSSLRSTLVQIDCRTEDETQARTISAMIDARLSGFVGAQGATEFPGIFVRGVRDLQEDTDAGGSKRLFGESVDVEVWHQPA